MKNSLGLSIVFIGIVLVIIVTTFGDASTMFLSLKLKNFIQMVTCLKSMLLES